MFEEYSLRNCYVPGTGWGVGTRVNTVEMVPALGELRSQDPPQGHAGRDDMGVEWRPQKGA